MLFIFVVNYSTRRKHLHADNRHVPGDTSETKRKTVPSVGHSGSRGFLSVSPRVVDIIESPGLGTVVLTRSVHSKTLLFFSSFFSMRSPESMILDQTFLQFLYVVRDACRCRPTSAKEGFQPCGVPQLSVYMHARQSDCTFIGILRVFLSIF